MVGIEETHDLLESHSPMVIPEHFRMDEGVTVAKICGEFHFGVLFVIPTNEAADKPNNDHVASGGGSDRRTHFWKRRFLTIRSLAMRDAGCYKSHRGQNTSDRGELPMPTVIHTSSPVHRQRVTGSDDAQLHIRCIRGCK